MDAIILKTLKAVKASEFDINRETLDNVDYCISLIESPGKIEKPAKVKETGTTSPAKEATIPVQPNKPTREELNKMKYWDIRRKFNITGEKSMKKDELIEIILKTHKD